MRGLIELITVTMLIAIVVGSVANGTLGALIASILFAVIVQMIWRSHSIEKLRTASIVAEDQLQVDIDLLVACKKDHKIRKEFDTDLVHEFGHAPDIRELGHGIRRRQRNLDVLRGMFSTQSAASATGATLLGVATFLSPYIAMGFVGVYALTRIRPCRVYLRTINV